jgi:type I restriction enzyme M protein
MRDFGLNLREGLAFEKFLGTTFRGELGQFFTPRPVV